MKTIKVKSNRGDYAVYVGQNLLSKTGRLMRALRQGKTKTRKSSAKAMIVTQKNIAEHYLKPVYASLERAGFRVHIHLIPQGERSKSQKELFRIYQELLKEGFERSDFLVALGGGVVGDLTGFAASTYLRGISFVNIATTLLSQVDSAVGGKTGINVEEGKNLVGTFYPAQLVISDVSTLRTLPEREMRASLAEVVKYGVIRDAKLFRMLEKKGTAVYSKQLRLLSEIVYTCAYIKAQVVMRDERETKGERMILNYGHTFGHAFEKVLQYKKMVHGEAVSVGMVCAARMAVMLNLIPLKTEMRQFNLLNQLNLPVSIAKYGLKTNEILMAMQHDKKKTGGDLRFVVPDRLGHVVVRKGVSSRITKKVIQSVGGL